jgi:predicted RNase H-like nuclease (RuvC/YqgF family)
MSKQGVKFYTFILFFFLIGITTFSIFRYLSSLKEKYGLVDNLNKTKEELGVLDLQRQNLLQAIEKAKKNQQKLSQENAVLTNSLKVSEEELMRSKADSVQLDSAMEELNSQNSLLKTENMALREDMDRLKVQITEASQENEGLKERLSSITELKKAIIELKKRPHKLAPSIKKQARMEMAPEGNQGFIVKGGASTHPAKIKIEVNPVQER